jgi:hypothetical protein
MLGIRTTRDHEAVAMDWQGNCLIVWDDNSDGKPGGPRRARYAADGHPLTGRVQPLTPITTGDQFLDTVAVDKLTDERFVTGWLRQRTTCGCG